MSALEMLNGFGETHYDFKICLNTKFIHYIQQDNDP